MSGETESIIQRQWVKTAAGMIPYRVGSAFMEQFPVILVHGFVMSGTYMIPAGERLASFCPVYIPDLLGYGKSEKPAKVLGLWELATSLVPCLHAQKINSINCDELSAS